MKVLVIGDAGTGKTSMIRSYVQGTFSSKCRSTIGVDFAVKVIPWSKQRTVRLQLWDIAGQERHGSMTRIYYKEAVGALLFFDISVASSWDNVILWKKDLDEKIGNIPVILVANKMDLITPKNDYGWKERSEMLDEFCYKNNFLAWFDISVKDGTPLEPLSSHLVTEMLKNQGVGDEVQEGEKNPTLVSTSFTLSGAMISLETELETCQC